MYWEATANVFIHEKLDVRTNYLTTFFIPIQSDQHVTLYQVVNISDQINSYFSHPVYLEPFERHRPWIDVCVGVICS